MGEKQKQKLLNHIESPYCSRIVLLVILRMWSKGSIEPFEREEEARSVLASLMPEEERYGELQLRTLCHFYSVIARVSDVFITSINLFCSAVTAKDSERMIGLSCARWHVHLMYRLFYPCKEHRIPLVCTCVCITSNKVCKNIFSCL